jgi:hypothetical protein
MMEYWKIGILGLGRMGCVINAISSPKIYCKMDNSLEEPTFQDSTIPSFREHKRTQGVKTSYIFNKLKKFKDLFDN